MSGIRVPLAFADVLPEKEEHNEKSNTRHRHSLGQGLQLKIGLILIVATNMVSAGFGVFQYQMLCREIVAERKPRLLSEANHRVFSGQLVPRFSTHPVT